MRLRPFSCLKHRLNPSSHLVFFKVECPLLWQADKFLDEEKLWKATICFKHCNVVLKKSNNTETSSFLLSVCCRKVFYFTVNSCWLKIRYCHFFRSTSIVSPKWDITGSSVCLLYRGIQFYNFMSWSLKKVHDSTFKAVVSVCRVVNLIVSEAKSQCAYLPASQYRLTYRKMV